MRGSCDWENAMLRLSVIVACLLATISVRRRRPKTTPRPFSPAAVSGVEADFDKVAGVLSTTSGYIAVR